LVNAWWNLLLRLETVCLPTNLMEMSIKGNVNNFSSKGLQSTAMNDERGLEWLFNMNSMAFH